MKKIRTTTHYQLAVNFIFVLFFSSTLAEAQTTKSKVNFAYRQNCLEFNIQEDTSIYSPYILLFENDSLFKDVSWIEIGTDTVALPQQCKESDIIRILIFGNVETTKLRNYKFIFIV